MDENEKKITIVDVARDAKVGIGTVSRAINGKSGVSSKTREKIFRSIEKLGYVPDVIAQSMRSNKYKNIVFFANVVNVAFSSIAKGIQRKLDQSGYTLSFCDIGETDITNKIKSFLAGRKFDGIILSVPSEDDEELNIFLRSLNTPVVSLNRDIPGLSGAVLMDYYSSVKRATEYLLSLGHPNIALLVDSHKIHPTNASIQAFKDAFTQNGYQLVDHQIVKGNITSESGQNMMNELLPRINKGEITALLVLNNQIFQGVLKVMRAHNIDYPNHISIIAVEDNELTNLLNPPVTVIKRPLAETGESLSSLLIELIERPNSGGRYRTITVPTEFIVRDSCGMYRKEKRLNYTN
jgi:LacI family transcriptional regulator